jgi:hypothetical protein
MREKYGVGYVVEQSPDWSERSSIRPGGNDVETTRKIATVLIVPRDPRATVA